MRVRSTYSTKFRPQGSIRRRLQRRHWIEKIRRKNMLRKKGRHISRQTVRGSSKGHERLMFLREKLSPTKGYDPYYEPARRHYIVFPKVFSLLDNTEESLACIASLLKVQPGRKKTTTHFDHRYCEKIDLAANAVFDVCAMMIREEQRSYQPKPYPISGRYPESKKLVNFIKLMGITKHLNVRGEEPPPLYAKLIEQLPLKHGKKRPSASTTDDTDQNKVASGLAVHLNRCFKKSANYELTDEGVNQIVKWAGEIIGNAEEHSGFSDWYAMSFMDIMRSKSEGGFIGECQLVIFGFGRSIYESLTDDSTPAVTQNEVRAMALQHAKKGFFGLGATKYSEQDLWTMYALQDGISSKSPGPGQNDRGRGTPQLIEAFQTLGQTLDVGYSPKMILLSGSTKIVFDTRYRMQEKPVEGGMRRIIAFNEQNNLEDKPDEKNVSSIDGFFPGTLLALRFYLDRAFLKTIDKGD